MSIHHRASILLAFIATLGCKQRNQSEVRSEETTEENGCVAECDEAHEKLRQLWHLDTFESGAALLGLTDEKIQEYINVDMRGTRDYLDQIKDPAYDQAISSFYILAFRLFVSNPLIQRELQTTPIVKLYRPQVVFTYKTSNKYVFFVGATAHFKDDLKMLGAWIEIPDNDAVLTPKHTAESFYNNPNAGGGIEVTSIRRFKEIENLDGIQPVESMTDGEVGGRFIFDQANAAHIAASKPGMVNELGSILPVERPHVFWLGVVQNLVVYSPVDTLMKNGPTDIKNKRAVFKFSYYRRDDQDQKFFSIAHYDLANAITLQ
ncbi:MAG: hypothetical protein AB7T49_04255 [Oligoflexales bacterium]